MKFEYRLNVNDIKEANQAHAKKGLLRYYLLMIGILLLLPVLPLLTQKNITLNDVLSVILPNLFLIIIVYFSFRIFSNFMIKRTWNSQPGLKNEITVETTEEGLQITTPLSESRIRWLMYTHWRETQNLFMVYQARNCFNLFPKRAFSSDEQINEFRELLRRVLANK